MLYQYLFYYWIGANLNYFIYCLLMHIQHIIFYKLIVCFVYKILIYEVTSNYSCQKKVQYFPLKCNGVEVKSSKWKYSSKM